MQEKDPLAVALGQRGGKKTALKGREFYQQIGAKGNKSQGNVLRPHIQKEIDTK